MTSVAPDKGFIKYMAPPFEATNYSPPQILLTMPSTSKHVRFREPCEEDQSPLPPMMASSPSSSRSSMDSPTLRTPPDYVTPVSLPYIPRHAHPFPSQTNLWGSPFAQARAAPLPYSPYLHPLLTSAHPQYPCSLEWDLRQSPDHARFRAPNGQYLHLTDEQLAASATFPPRSSLLIVCEYLAWSIDVSIVPQAAWSPPPRVRGARPPDPYVTVGDVLYCLYRNLRNSVRSGELRWAEESGTYVRVEGAFKARATTVDDARKGIRRVDCLMEMSRFAGLSLVAYHPQMEGDSRKEVGQVWSLFVR